MALTDAVSTTTQDLATEKIPFPVVILADAFTELLEARRRVRLAAEGLTPGQVREAVHVAVGSDHRELSVLLASVTL